MSILTDEDIESWLDTEDDDPEKYAHIIRRKSPEFGAEAVIVTAAAMGQELTALCGFRWKVRGLASDDLPACPKCQKVWSELV